MRHDATELTLMQIATDNPRIARVAQGANIEIVDLQGNPIEDAITGRLVNNTPVGSFRLFGYGIVQGEHVTMYPAPARQTEDSGCVLLALANVDVIWMRAD